MAPCPRTVPRQWCVTENHIVPAAEEEFTDLGCVLASTLAHLPTVFSKYRRGSNAPLAQPAHPSPGRTQSRRLERGCVIYVEDKKFPSFHIAHVHASCLAQFNVQASLSMLSVLLCS